MTIPGLLFGLLVSTLLGLLFHFVRGGGLPRMVLYVVVAWVGFWAGHLLGLAFGWRFLAFGPLNLGMAVLGALLLLGLVTWLSTLEVKFPEEP